MSTQALPDADTLRRILQETGIPQSEGHKLMSRVANQFNMGPQEMLNGGNQDRYVVPRYVAAYLLREKFGWSLGRIGNLIHKNNSTVLYGIRYVDHGRKVSPELDAIVKGLL